MLQPRALREHVSSIVSHRPASGGWPSMRVAPGIMVSLRTAPLAK